MVDSEMEKEVLSAYLAQNIIAALCVDIFANDKVMKNLVKSPAFSKDLFALFARFSESDIKPAELYEAAVRLPDIDAKRFVLVIMVYEAYLGVLDENGFEINETERKNSKVLDVPSIPVELYLFEDIHAEISSIAQRIKSKVEDGAKYSDFAVLIRDYNSRRRFADLFKTFDIPVSGELCSDSFTNFKNKMIRYLKISGVYEKLGIEEFSKTEFEKLKFISKAQIEIYYNEMNTYIQSMLTEVLEDTCARDRFISLMEQNSGFSLLNIVYSNLDILKENDRKALKEELDNMKKFFTLYKSGKILEMIAVFSSSQNLEKETVAHLLGTIKAVSNLYNNILKVKLPVDVLAEIIDSAREYNESPPDSVTIAPLCSSKKFKHVFIPCMSENSLPAQNHSVNFISPDSNEKLSALIRSNHPEFSEVVISDKTHNQTEYEMFMVGLNCAKESLTLCAHLYEDKKECTPSPYFDEMIERSGFEPRYIEKSLKSSEIKALSSSESKKISETVLREGEVLKLNPSAISNYLKCPRSYYFKSLLNLKEQSVFAANYGNIVHAVLEVFNTTCLDKYTKETLLVLKDILFDSVENRETALQAGFKELDTDLIKASDKLALMQMSKNFEDAVKELEKNGWFFSVPQKAVTEKSFRFSLHEIDNVVFDGRIDVILQDGGKYRVVDYKSGKNKENDLEYAVSEYGVNFLTKTGRVPARVEEYERKYDYQIPIYYLACQNAEELSEFKDKVDELGLQYIRPSNKDGGWNEDFIAAESIDVQKEKILANLKTTVIDKIRGSVEFEKCESFNCADCAYAFLCDEEEADD